MTKKIILLTLLLPVYFIAQAQEASGKILYTYLVEYGVDDEELSENPNLIGWVDEGWGGKDTIKKELLFHEGKSLFHDYVEKEVKATNEKDDRYWYYNSNQEKYDELYTDTETGETVHGLIFYEKKFLVEEVENNREWKVTNNSLMIDGYLCMQAICTDTFINADTDTISKIVAWFSPQIKTTACPAELGGLPGVILKAKITGKESTTTIEAKEIELEGISASDIKKPKEGKKVKFNKFQKIKERKIKESEENRGYWKDKYQNDNPIFGD